MRELRVTNVSLTYNAGEIDQLEVLTNCTFQVLAGSPLIIKGSNGSGKSTLLKALAGRLSPVSGSIEVIDSNDDIIRSRQWLQRNVDYLPQSPLEALVPDLSLAEHLVLNAPRKLPMFSPYFASDNLVNEESRLAEYMEKYRGYRHRRVMDLSGGEKQLFALALAEYRSAPVVLLDEPTAALDKNRIKEVEARLVSWLRRDSVIAIMVTHDSGLAERVGVNVQNIDNLCQSRTGSTG